MTCTYPDCLAVPEAAALIALALSARAMIEDGHPESSEWFQIMANRVHAVDWEAIDHRDLGYD
jgi:hypothetical protein